VEEFFIKCNTDSMARLKNKGVTLAQILDHVGWLIHTSKTPEPTGEQLRKLHDRLFSMAPDFKNTITEMVGI
jgi:hypothetical protein